MPEFSHFIQHLKNELQLPLPGEEAQYKMAPLGRKQRALEGARARNAKKSAVLVHFYPFEREPHLVFILRNAYKGVHSQQVSFPGGKHEPEDASLMHTALREAHEEVGVHPNGVKVIGRLSQLYIPPSNFLVDPYVGFSLTRPNFQKEEKEVQEIIEAPARKILDPATVKETLIEMSNGFSIKTPYYDINGHVVWGATAMMLSELKSILLNTPFANR